MNLNINKIIFILILLIGMYYYQNIKPLDEQFESLVKNKFKIIIYFPFGFDINIGGLVVLTYFAIKINEILKDKIVYLFNNSTTLINNENIYFDNFTNDINFDKENTIVIYPEITHGNPLNAKYIVRWILAELSINCSGDIYKSWGKDDLVYYYNKEIKMDKNSEKMGNIYKMLTLIYVNPKISITNFEPRNDWCFTYRKSHIHKNINIIHPDNSFEINRYLDQNKCIEVFNKYKYFVSYDPLTFLYVMSLLCGCITIVYPIEGINKKEWLKTTIFNDYLTDNNIDNIYGFAYGLEDLPFAEETINKAPDQVKDIINNINNEYLNTFLNDMKNFQNNKEIKFENTVENNYY